MEYCCKNEIYISDSFCPVCGTKISVYPTLNSAFTIDPSITDTFAGLGEPYTGKVLDTAYYVRTHSNISSGFIWLTLITEQGEEKKININGESDTFQNIKKGDVLSFISPAGVTHYHSPSGINKELISHDNSPAIMVLHGKDGNNVSSVASCITEPDEIYPSAGSCYMVAIASGVVAGLMFNNWGVDPKSIWFISACVLPVICIMLASRANKGNKRNQEYADNALIAQSKLLNVFYSALGYERDTRPTSQSDHICHSCNNVVNHLVAFCNHCGVKRTSEKEQIALATIEQTSEDTATLSVNVQPENDLIQSPDVTTISSQPIKTIRQHNQMFFEQYAINEQYDYNHKHSLTSNKAHEITISSRLVRVLDKDMGVNTNAGVHESTTKTDYINSYGSVVFTKEHTTYHAFRDISLNGHLIIEDKDGSISAFKPNERVLAATNIGDLILIGESTIKRFDQTHRFLEFVHNVNKNKTIKVPSHSISSYYPSLPKMSIFNLIFMPVLVVMLLGAITPLFNSNVAVKITVMIGIAISLLYYFLMPIVFGIQNGNNKKKLLPKLRSLLSKCKENSKEILNNIK